MQVHLKLGDGLDGPLRYLRPAAIFAGLAVFLLGALVLGAALASTPAPRVYLSGGPILLLLGVALVGGGLVMEPSEYWLDPEVEFTGLQRQFVAGASALFLCVAGLVALFGG